MTFENNSAHIQIQSFPILVVVKKEINKIILTYNNWNKNSFFWGVSRKFLEDD